MPDLEPKTVEEVKQHFIAGFGDADMEIIPDEEGKVLIVDVRCRTALSFTAAFPCARSRLMEAMSRK